LNSPNIPYIIHSEPSKKCLEPKVIRSVDSWLDTQIKYPSDP